MIAKCKALEWGTEILKELWPFVWRLFSGLSTTKTSQEDILQELTNLERANRRKDIALPRAAFHAAVSKRLRAVPCNVLKCEPGDILVFGGEHKINVDNFVPRKYNAEEESTDSVVPKAIKWLSESKSTSQPSQDHNYSLLHVNLQYIFCRKTLNGWMNIMFCLSNVHQ